MKDSTKSRKRPQGCRAAIEEARHLKAEIDRSRCAIDIARNHFEQVIDPTMIDCYIYELNAAQLRYQFLLKTYKKRES